LAGVPFKTHGAEGGNGPVFAFGFYRLILPFLVMVLFVMIPAFRGMHDGVRFSRRFTI
jgi:hypothetical protein